MTVVSYYRKIIAQGKGIAYFAVFIAFLLRLCSSFFVEEQVQETSFIWDFIAPFFTYLPFSFITAFCFSIGIALYSSYINTKYALIRERTFLPFSFTVLFLSCPPSLVFMAPPYVSILFFLISLDTLLGTYQSKLSARSAYQVGFMLALAALFSPDMLFYLLLMWIGFSIMRSFSIKVILASLLAVVMVHIIYVFTLISLSLWDDFVLNIAGQVERFVQFSLSDINYFDLAFAGVVFLVGIIIIINNFANELKDKIRTRRYMYLFNTFLIVSSIIYVATFFKLTVNLYIALFTAAFVSAYFFALIEKKWKVYFFSFCSLLFFVSYAYLLINKAYL